MLNWFSRLTSIMQNKNLAYQQLENGKHSNCALYFFSFFLFVISKILPIFAVGSIITKTNINMRKIVLLLAMIAASLNSFAQKFTVENANGNILSYKVLSKTDKTIAVTQGKDKLPVLIIPSTVEYEGITYSVTEIAWKAFFAHHCMF